MAQDGSREVEWKGQAFPYLMHHPNSFFQTQNYGSHKQGEQGHTSNQVSSSSDAHAPAGTGTWNGPAPRGSQRPQGGAEAGAAEAAVQEPQYVRIGQGSAYQMPMLGLGTAGTTSPDVITKALELGYRHFDCAGAYENEGEVVGKGLQAFIAAGRRAELFITSKIPADQAHPDRIRAACEKTLADLGCQYLDLYLMHWPEILTPGSCATFHDAVTIDNSVTFLDTWKVMETLVKDGLVRNIGVSNFSVPQVEQLLSSCRIPPAVNQVELHCFLPQRKLVGVCYRKGVQCVAYSPLGGFSFKVQNTLLSHPVVAQVAQETGKTPAQVLLRWNLQRGVPVIPRASSEEHLRNNIEGAFTWRLNNTHKAMLDGLENGTRFISPTWKVWADPEEGGVAKPSLQLAA